MQQTNVNFTISAEVDEGMDALINSIEGFARTFFGTEPALVSRERHRVALKSTMAALDRALSEGIEGREDIIAEELRSAANTLGKLTGRIDVEDILDVIFRDFCIGK